MNKTSLKPGQTAKHPFTARRWVVGSALGTVLAILGQGGQAQEFIQPAAMPEAKPAAAGAPISGPVAPVGGAARRVNPSTIIPAASGSAATLGTVAGTLVQAETLLRQGQPRQAQTLYRKVINTPDEGQRAQARYGLAYTLDQLGQDRDALEILESTPADDSPVGRAIAQLRGLLVLQLAEAAWWQDTPVDGKDLSSWLNQYARLTVQPDAVRAQRLQSYLAPATQEGGVVSVGVLLPLSGPLKSIGEELLQGIQLGVQARAKQGGDHVVIKPFDTAGGVKAAAQAALDSGAQVVLGPLRSPEVGDAAGVLQPAKVPLLVFSSDQDILQDGVWSLSFSPAGQARRVASYAMETGRTKVAGLVPDNAYGHEAWETFAAEVKRQGGSVTGVSYFNPLNVDISASVRSLVGTGAKGSKVTPPFQSLFIPAPAASLPLIAAQLAYYDLDRAGVQLLGTALWQDPAMLSPRTTGAVGTIFAAPGQAPAFEAFYQNTFGKKPGLMANVGADAGRLVSDLAFLKMRSDGSVSDLLLRPGGWPGYAGYLTLDANGRSGRDQAIIQVDGGQAVSGTAVTRSFKVIEAALPLAPLPLPDTLRPAPGGRGAARVW